MARRGSTKKKCQAYKADKTRELNKARKINKHLKTHPNCEIAKSALKSLGR